MKNLVVEINDKTGQRLERLSLTEGAITFGRAWDNDVILQDHYVDADHFELSLSEDMALVVSDLGSTNGTKVGNKSVVNKGCALRLGETVKVGDTRLCFHDQNSGVVAASPRSSWFLVADRFSDLTSMFLLTLVAIAVAIANNYLLASTPMKLETMLVYLVGIVLAMLAWSLVFGFVSKLVRGESNFKALWILACLGIIILDTLIFFQLLLRFNLQDAQLGQWINLLPGVIVSAWIAVGVLSYITHWESRPKWVVAILLSAVIVGMARSGELQKEEHQKWSASSNTEKTTLPPSFLFRKPVSVEDYQTRTESLFEFDQLTN